MSEQTIFTLGEAAKVAGVGKSTISKAISGGRLSVMGKENGQFQIAASELFRVFPPKSAETVGDEQSETPEETMETAVLRAQVEALTQRVRDKDDTIDDLRRRLDAESEERRKLTHILTDQRQAPAPATPITPPAPATEPRRRLFGILPALPTRKA